MIKRYEHYKDSGVEWLGEIPEHWEITRLANIGRFSSSGIDKLIKKNESLVKIVNYTDIYKNLEHSINSKMNFMEVTTPETNRVKNLVNKGDLIFLPSSETLEDLGLSALVDEDIENLSFSYHVLRFEFTTEISHSFKKYFTNNQSVLNEFSKKGTGSIRKTLGRNDFRNIIVILPPLPEQTAIAQFLDDKTTKIDQAIAIKQQQIALLKERKQILIHKAVTRGLNDKVALKDSGVECLPAGKAGIGEIPEHWEVKRLGVISNVIDPQPDHRAPKMDENGLPYLGIRDINEDGTINIHTARMVETKAVEKQEKSFTLNDGDILYGKVGTLGNPKRVILGGKRVALSATLVIIKTKGVLMSRYLKFALDSDLLYSQIKRIITGATRPALGIQQIRKFKVVIPNDNELEKVVTELETASAKIETAISIKEQEIEKLQEYKRSLINSVVTGKVRVC